MSERLPYEENLKQQLADLPLPDENLAWDEMRKLLEEDDDDAVIIPPIRRGCGGWILLFGLILIGFIWFYFRPFTSNSKEIVTKQSKTDTSKLNAPSGSIPDTNTEISTSTPDGINIKRGSDISESDHMLLSRDPADSLSANQDDLVNGGRKGTRRSGIRGTDNPTSSDSKYRTARTSYKSDTAVVSGKRKKKISVAEATIATASNSTIGSNNTISNNINAPQPQTQTIDSVGTGKDSVLVKNKLTDSVIVKSNNPDSVKSKKKEVKTYSWGAGLALHQQIPFAGQTAVPYNSMGRTGSLADYIPSVYLRYYQDKHWFIESEFRYGAPQYTEELVYDVKKNNVALIDTMTKLKKTYYHQLPLSFNYYLFPNFSLGTGIVWNRFSSAVSEKEVVVVNSSGSIDSTLSTEIVTSTRINDSVFAKSYWTWQVQAQYTWKRLMLGVRYSKGLQPYIKFTLPGGQSQQQSSQSLQIFLRYEIWRSKKK